MKKLKFLFSAIILLSAYANASLTADRTRVIYDAEKPGVSVVIQNTDTKDPFLLQTWIESADGKKITDPLTALPLLQRIEPGQKKQIRISTSANDAQLPQDRESLFYFNTLGVPPKSNLENVVEVVLQSRFKLFYRPKGLKKYPDNNWQQELTLEKKANELILNNPTPYHLVVININNGPQKVKDFSEILVKPYSKSTYPLSERLRKGSEFMLTYIDDYGTTKTLKYRCSGAACSLIKEKS